MQVCICPFSVCRYYETLHIQWIYLQLQWGTETPWSTGMHLVRTLVVYIQGINPEWPCSIPKFCRLNITHACALLPPRFHCNPELTGKTLPRLNLLHVPSSPWLVTTVRDHLRRTPILVHLLPKSLPDQCEGPLSSNPSSWGDFLILETASSSYHWSLLLMLHQQQSQFHRSTLQSSRSQLQNCPCL